MIELYRANPTDDYYIKIHNYIDKYYEKQCNFLENKFEEACSMFSDSLSKGRITKRFYEKSIKKYEEVYQEDLRELHFETSQLRNILNSI